MSFIEGWGNSLTEAFRAFGIEQRQKKQRASPSGRSHPAASEPPFSEAQNEFVQGLLQSSLFGVGTYLSDRFAETDLKTAEVLKVAQDVALQVQQISVDTLAQVGFPSALWLSNSSDSVWHFRRNVWGSAWNTRTVDL